MKTAMLALSLLFGIQFTGFPQTNSVNPEAARLRAQFLHKWKPLRVIGGRLYDFTPYFAAWVNNDNWEQFNCRLEGKVTQVVSDGLLVHLDSGERIHVRNHRDQASLLDGSPITVLAKVIGRYQYITTQGAQSTIADFDCGRTFHIGQDKYEKKWMVNAHDDQLTALTPLDLAAFDLITRTNNPGQ